ncbi:MAG: hypothetical protein LKJ17_12560 [Oscillospiraceae bacterium]|nr:hypothetical protein [Oscillospiraceae bacterium]
MQKGLHIRTILLCSGTVLLLALFCIRVYSLNKRFPPATVEHYASGELVNFDTKGKYTGGKAIKNAFQITTSDFEVYTKADLISKFQLKSDDIPSDRFPQYKKKVLMFTIRARNISNTKQVLELYYMNMQCTDLGLSYAIDLDWFKAVNANNSQMSLQPSMAPGQTVTLFLPFEITNEHITENHLDKINQEKFDLILSLYPNKKLINLNY